MGSGAFSATHAVTVVLVTHEPEEAAALADRRLVLLNGRLVSEGGE